MLSPWSTVFVGVVVVCGAFVPGPCSFDPQRKFDCSLGAPCERNFACADDGYCKSADVACLDGEQRCEVPDHARVGLCVKDEDLATSKTHCGACFAHCLGKGECKNGECTGAPAAGRCILSRGHFDCAAAGLVCVDDGNGDDEGDCAAGTPGKGALLAACKEARDCASGICAVTGAGADGVGVCTSTCDFGCAFGTQCDDSLAPGGVCVPVNGEVCR